MLAIVNKFSFGTALLLLYIMEVCLPWKWRHVCRHIAIHTDEVHNQSELCIDTPGLKFFLIQ
jgi:hypothetical protein